MTIAKGRATRDEELAKRTQALVRKGRDQGFITQDEILGVFPRAELHLGVVDGLYDKLLKSGVDIFESVTEEQIREDEEAIQVFGYNTLYFKLAVFMIGAGMAAIAGSFFASYITFIDPSGFTLMESVFILVIIILGGLANLRGSVLGALFLILLPEILRFVGFPSSVAAQMRQLVYGLILILLMLYRPQGLLGEYKI